MRGREFVCPFKFVVTTETPVTFPCHTTKQSSQNVTAGDNPLVIVGPYQGNINIDDVIAWMFLVHQQILEAKRSHYLKHLCLIEN